MPPSYSAQRLVMLPEPSDDTRVLVGAACRGVEQLFRPGFEYKKVEIMLLDLADREKRQAALWPAHAEPDRTQALMAVVDRINAKMGRNTVALAAAGTPRSGRAWQTRRENLSPQYTTCWDELPRAQA